MDTLTEHATSHGHAAASADTDWAAVAGAVADNAPGSSPDLTVVTDALSSPDSVPDAVDGLQDTRRIELGPDRMFTGLALDTAAAWRTPTGVVVWVTGDCLAVVTDALGEHTVIGCEESPYGVDAELAYARLRDRGADHRAAAAGATEIRRRDLATTNTPAGRSRITDIAPAAAVTGNRVTLPNLPRRVTLLTPGAVRLLAAGGYVSPAGVDAFCAGGEGFTARVAMLWDWLQAIQDADPEHVELPRHRDVDEAAVAVLPVP
jgi:hypothetical protein